MPTDPLKKSAPAPVCVTAAASTQHAELCVRAGAEGGFSGFCRLSATSGATKWNALFSAVPPAHWWAGDRVRLAAEKLHPCEDMTTVHFRWQLGLVDRAGGRCRACSISLISAHIEKLLDARGGLRESAVFVSGGDVTCWCTLLWCAECSPSASPSSPRLPPPSPPSRLSVPPCFSVLLSFPRLM